jgi:hypothetical protein
MKQKLTIVALGVLMASVSAVQSQTLSVQFGSTFEGATASIFSNEAKVGYVKSDASDLLAMGYFSDGFDISTGAAGITDSASLSTFLGNFTPMHSDNFGLATADGFFSAGNANVAEQAVGKTAYVMTLADVSSWANASSATEIGLFTDSSFGSIPAGAEPIAADYIINTLTYDSVVLGKQHLGEALTGVFDGMTGNVYASQAIGNAVPEPSTYALFLGVFSLGFVIWRKRAVKNTATE